jgi:hypothetical protein
LRWAQVIRAFSKRPCGRFTKGQVAELLSARWRHPVARFCWDGWGPGNKPIRRGREGDCAYDKGARRGGRRKRYNRRGSQSLQCRKTRAWRSRRGNYNGARITVAHAKAGLTAGKNKRFRGLLYGSGGSRRSPQRDSISCAIASTVSSSNGRPTTCTPMGRPSGERPTGTTTAGLPSALNHWQ